MSHFIYEGPGDLRTCSCGQAFNGPWAALDHALPLAARELADAVAADPQSSPELIARAEKIAQDAARHD